MIIFHFAVHHLLMKYFDENTPQNELVLQVIRTIWGQAVIYRKRFVEMQAISIGAKVDKIHNSLNNQIEISEFNFWLEHQFLWLR